MINVRFPRVIKQGTQGKDVLAHKRAISRARPDLYPWHEFTDYAGGKFMHAVVVWKKSRHLNNQPMIGKTAHELLERTHSKTEPDTWAFDLLAIKLAQEYYDAVQAEKAGDTRRKLGVDAAFFWYSHRMGIQYSQARPFQMGKPIWTPSRWDCSAFATNCHYAAGAKDPNNRGYDHLGYTGTLMDTGKKVGSIEQLEPLDLIFYGSSPGGPGFPVGSPTHVATYVGKFDGVHMVISNGHYPMGFYPYNYRSINHLRHYEV